MAAIICGPAGPVVPAVIGAPLGPEPGVEMPILGVSGLDGRPPCTGAPALAGGALVIGGKANKARSISDAPLQRCSSDGASAFITIWSKAGVISGRSVRNAGKEKIPG